MTNRIKYILGLMTICILGVILTQGLWLYKDYTYYSGQPLFSKDFDMFLPVQTLGAQPADAKSIIAFSTTVEASPVTFGRTTRPAERMENMQPGTVTPGLSAIVAYPATLAIEALPAKFNRKNSVMTSSPIIAARKLSPGDLKSRNTTENYIVKESGAAKIYRAVPYKAPILHVLQKMKWQFGASILLILFTTSCFIYMLVTIFMQRKLSVVKNDMINNMTHELKTPLSTVSVAIEAMRNYEILEDKDKTNLYLNVSKNELDHLSRLIEMILELSVFEHHKMILFRELIDINHLISSIVKKYSLAEEPADIHLYLDDAPEILADPVHLGNAIRNLIDNAIKYTLIKPQIVIRSQTTKKGWLLTVSDNGIGIPEIYQKSVFDQFFRVPDKRLLRVKGFGLGLSYVKQVVDQHSGTIALFSNEKSGSIFTILIPVK
ncbi:sensor histidine kinase [Pedobacter sp. NJ-S-72]